MNNTPQRDLFVMTQKAQKAQELLYLNHRDLTKGEREEVSDTIDLLLAALRDSTNLAEGYLIIAKGYHAERC